jgi:hypothetical protein
MGFCEDIAKRRPERPNQDVSHPKQNCPEMAREELQGGNASY